METINLLEIASLAIVIAVMAVSVGASLYRLINQSGPGSVMWHN
jgi:hypothetical protein